MNKDIHIEKCGCGECTQLRITVGSRTYSTDDFPERIQTLIAAAPDLYLALRACIDDLERYARKSGPGPDRRLKKALAALRKAEK